MDMTSFWAEIDAKIAKFDLLCHPFYRAWSNGELTREDLRMYATEYYGHIEAFPEYLEELEVRLPEGKTRNAIAENKREELGVLAADKRSHSDLWLDFAEGMGAKAEEVRSHQPMANVASLIEKFRSIAREGAPIEALTAFYAYESQIPRVAKEKALGLKQRYGANATTYKYFSVHATADIEHTKDWKELVSEELRVRPENMALALTTAESIAESLWRVLDQVESKRLEAKQAVC